MREIYLDNSATTRVCNEAAEKVMQMMTQTYGNPSSLHTMGFRAEKELNVSRENIAKALAVKPEEIVFTSGGTESNNLAVFGAAMAKKRSGNHIITTAVEHPSVLQVMHELERQGFKVTYLLPDGEGHIFASQVEEALTAETVLVSIMAVNNEVGSRMPIKETADVLRRAKSKALFHVDAVQAFGKIRMRPAKDGVDLLTVSSHKIHGPKGAGALYVRKGVHLVSRTFGGGQEKGIRPGTEAVPALCGFGEAARMIPPYAEQTEKISGLWQLCREQLSQISGVILQSPKDALPYILNFSAGSVRSETMLHFLASKGIYVSSGSACSKGELSHVLSAMNIPKKQIDSSIRVSFSRENTEQDVYDLTKAVAQGISALSQRS